MPDIDGVGRALRDAADRGKLDRAEVDAAVERWKAADAGLSQAASTPMPQRDIELKPAMDEYDFATAAVKDLMLRV